MTRQNDHTEPDIEAVLGRRRCLALTGVALTSTVGLSGLAVGNDGSSTDGSTNDGATDTTTSYEKVLSIDGTGEPDVTAQYRFTVTGSVARDQERSTVSESGLPWDTLDDTLENGEVGGIVGNGVDAYQYSGKLTAIDVRGKARFNVEKL